MEDIIPAKINTTVIGSYPRPAELHVPNWFDSKWEDVVSGK
jgi:methionine synthase II (cobalamin-independent)